MLTAVIDKNRYNNRKFTHFTPMIISELRAQTPTNTVQ